MTARLIDGKHWAAVIREEIRQEVGKLLPLHRPPGLGVILVGDNPASRVYVTSKEKACAEVGIHSVEHLLPASVSTEDVLQVVDSLNRDDRIDGILVQLPLPPQVDVHRVLCAISPDKDVDGFHPENVGLLAIGKPRFVPCTPLGVIELLQREKVDISGKNAVVVGRSNIVGKPVAQLLLAHHATVTLCHSRTRCLQTQCFSADILVAAIGKAHMIQGAWIRPGAVVIDVGINRLEAPEGGKAKLVGDVDFDSAKEKASLITPVPGGVGPMTIAMLLRNTLQSARLRLGVEVAV